MPAMPPPVAGRRVLPLVLAGVLAVAVTPAPATGTGCTCDAFCEGACAPFDSGKLPPPVPARPAGGGLQNITLYRFTPRSIRAVIAETNTGDIGGDLGFFVDRRALTARCALEPTSLRCFLAPWSEVVFARWELEIDTGYGPYLACNPAYGNPNGTTWDLSHYLCSQACVVPPFCGGVAKKNNSRGGDGQTTCYCDRAKRSVGIESFVRVRSPTPTDATHEPTLPTVCQFGTEPSHRGCLKGEVTNVWNGSSVQTVASSCCASCTPPDCTGWSVTRPVDGQQFYTCRTFRGNLALALATPSLPAGEKCVGSASRDPLPGGSWNWGVMGVSGGSWYSTPTAGQCTEWQRPGDGSGCTWRVRQPPTFIESTCVNDMLDAAVMKASPSCFKSCGHGGRSSDNRTRKYSCRYVTLLWTVY